MQPPEPPQYRSYLLRCWEECADVSDTRLWRFSLEDTRTGLRRGYASLDALTAALQAGLDNNHPPEPGDPPHRTTEEDEKWS